MGLSSPPNTLIFQSFFCVCIVCIPATYQLVCACACMHACTHACTHARTHARMRACGWGDCVGGERLGGGGLTSVCVNIPT